MSGFKLQRLGMIMEPESGNPHEVEGVLNPGVARGTDGEQVRPAHAVFIVFLDVRSVAEVQRGRTDGLSWSANIAQHYGTFSPIDQVCCPKAELHDRGVTQ